MENDETPMKFLKEILALHDYFYAPQMSVVTFETKFDALKIRAEKEIANRLAEVGPVEKASLF